MWPAQDGQLDIIIIREDLAIYRSIVHCMRNEFVKTATEVGVRAIQDRKVIEWNTCWKCRLSEGIDDM